MQVIVFDIDGTLANIEHRLHHIRGGKKDWDSFFKFIADDEPILPLTNLVKVLIMSGLVTVLFVTGRPERTRIDTINWLRKHEIIPNSVDDIYMRDDNDRRPDFMVKEEILSRMKMNGLTPDLIFDDRKAVVEMWRRNKLLVAQVGSGNF